ncbi:GTP-binding protein SAR1-like [Ruditapes philippinarum]|uniref:GTP-binding protein SAR1-like n=1 Tax=Ruditapes philippinarum TaxID=129788 RepID=UPI00295B3651|nr:GTP-binding protein SAR1-like [Ruditapes philippinarum]
MFLFDWMKTILSYFGFKEKKQLLILGLDNSGKSSLLHLLSNDVMASNSQTYNGASQVFDVGTTRFETVDLVGPPGVRKVWKNTYPSCDAIIFLVDCTDNDRFKEANEELDTLLQNKSVIDVPVAVLYNKIDKTGAASENDLSERLQLMRHKTGKILSSKPDLICRPLETFPCSDVKRVGYGEALRWLAYYVK